MGKEERVQSEGGSGSGGRLLNAPLSSSLPAVSPQQHRSELTEIKRLRLWVKTAVRGPQMALQEVTCGPQELMQVAKYFNAKKLNKKLSFC